jgi:hypothetical protein
MDDEEAERVQAAVEVVAEMQLTAEQLKVRQQGGLPCSVILVMTHVASMCRYSISSHSQL